MSIQYRQGDVFIEQVDRLPAGLVPAVPDERGRIVLALGEQTGHAHTLPATACLQAGWTEDGVLHFQTRDDTAVGHEEHDPIVLPPGAHRVLRQREYHPAEIRHVAD